MATSVRLRRLRGNSDLRNYVLNNAWSNYVPGESADTEILEKAVKGMDGDKQIRPALREPWSNPIIRLMQRCYAPVTLCDVQFDRLNARSNANGDWPTTVPAVAAGTEVRREVALFNDTLKESKLTLEYEISTQKGGVPVKIASGKLDRLVDAGNFGMVDVVFTAPADPCELTARYVLKQDGAEVFREEAIRYRVTPAGSFGLPDGAYLLVNLHSGLPAEASADSTMVQGAAVEGAQVWMLKHLGGDGITLTNAATGQVLAVAHNGVQNGAPAIQARWNELTNQVWRLEQSPDGSAYTITNKSSGRSLDVYGRSTTAGGRIVVWEANGGDNQLWRFVPAKHK
jgi:hypothetical protein